MAPRSARRGCCLGCGAVIGEVDRCGQCGLAQKGLLADRLPGLLEQADLALDRLRQEDADLALDRLRQEQADLTLDRPRQEHGQALEGQRQPWVPPGRQPGAGRRPSRRR
jgi:hypothetical protein